MHSPSSPRAAIASFGLIAVAFVASFAIAQPSSAAGAASVIDPHAFSDVAERAVRSVVNVAVVPRVQAGSERGFFGPRGHGGGNGGQPQHGSLGSGVVVSRDGLVLTNNHVVAHEGEIAVTLQDGRKLKAILVGRDPQSDIAVLRLQNAPDDLEPMTLGDSSKVRLGEIVMAIGSPFGLAQTVTLGIISAKGRSNVGIVDYEDFIQTDASINPGNSGGALINTRGELVGINTAIASRSGGSQGIGFAIPAAMAARVMKSLVDTGTVDRGWLGVMIQDLDVRLAEHFGLKDARGVLVADVQPGSPAADGGLMRGDVILAVDGQAVTDTARLRNHIAGLAPGAEPELSMWRGRAAKRIRVKLGKARSKVFAGAAAPATATAPSAWGLRFAELDDTLRARLRLEADVRGAVVVDVQDSSPSDDAGLRPGDVIVAVGQRGVDGADALNDVLAKGANARSLALLVLRDGGRRWVVLRR